MHVTDNGYRYKANKFFIEVPMPIKQTIALINKTGKAVRFSAVSFITFYRCFFFILIGIIDTPLKNTGTRMTRQKFLT